MHKGKKILEICLILKATANTVSNDDTVPLTMQIPVPDDNTKKQNVQNAQIQVVGRCIFDLFQLRYLSAQNFTRFYRKTYG